MKILVRIIRLNRAFDISSFRQKQHSNVIFAEIVIQVLADTLFILELSQALCAQILSSLQYILVSFRGV